MPEKNTELWDAYHEAFRRVAILDRQVASDFDVAAMNLKAAEVDQARLEALSGATVSGQLFFDGPTGPDGPEVTVRFAPTMAS